MPPIEPVVPYTRVNHNKYMVTDNAAYIGSYLFIVIPVLAVVH